MKSRPSYDLTRRGFHKSLLASAMMTVTGAPAAQSNTLEARLDIALNRLTFGASNEDRLDIETAGLSNWLDRELAKPAHDAALGARISQARLKIEYDAGRVQAGATWDATSELRPLSHLDAEPADLLKLLDYDLGYNYQERVRPAHEVIAASLIRAVHAPAQLREVMTQFWHDHFSVNALKDEHTAIYFPQHDAIMREYAFGNFRQFLGAVSRSPAMLVYLNNDVSRASPANENYGRELLELHTLGASHYFNDLYDDWKAVPGATESQAAGYIDQDVYEVARAFTGWTVGDGKWLEDGENAPETGKFTYVEAWHDPYQKRVMGVEFPPNRAKMADGENVLDILAAHPGTARFVTGKMLARLGIETPSPEYRKRVARSFLSYQSADDQIAQTVRAIVLDPEFLYTPPQKLRRPFEFLTGFYRATGAEVTSTNLDFNWWLERGGWTQHAVRPPTGHSDVSQDWANTRALNATVDLALFAHANWFETADLDLGIAHGGAETWRELAYHWADVLGADRGATLAGLPHVDATPDDPITGDAEYLEWVNRTLMALSALTPGFLFR